MPIVKANGIDIYVERHGQGDPLVLIHGTGFDSLAWAGQIPELSKKYEVIVFDNRGCGRSSTPDSCYTAENMADDVAALMDAIAIENAHILGYSMGGFIAMELAMKYPEKAKKLILASTCAQMYSLGRTRIKLFVRMLQEGVSPELVLRNLYLWFFTDRFFGNEGATDALLKNAAAHPYPQSIAGLLGQTQCCIEYSRNAETLSAIKLQTLVIASADDINVPPYLSKEIAANIPGATLKIIEGEAHAMPLEAPNKLNSAILEFLD